MSRYLEGRRALVTGASRGIGRAIAERLARAGANVAACARSEAAIREVAEATGGIAVPMDVADPDSIATALERVNDALGGIDILVNNAGVAWSKPYHRSDDEMWATMMNVHATSVYRLCRAVIPGMIEGGWGRVVVIASNAGLTGYAYSAAYCASKHAAVGYMRAVALEIAKSPVSMNAVCPGWVDTDMARDAVERIANATGKDSAEAKKALETMSPQGRMVSAEEVAETVAFLCHEEARGIHGQSLVIDGGALQR